MIFNMLSSSPPQRVLWVAALLAAVVLLSACGARDPALLPASTPASLPTPLAVQDQAVVGVPALSTAQPASALRTSCTYCFCLDYSATCI
jgi:hypothetical protein